MIKERIGGVNSNTIHLIYCKTVLNAKIYPNQHNNKENI
jgi:hypothetical protein